MSYIKDTIDYKGMSIKIYYDEDAESPREWDNLGTLYSNHRDYNPDGHKTDDLWNKFEYETNREFDTYEQECEAFWKWLNKNYIWCDVACYEHSGITIWVGDYHNHYDAQWDCGRFGIIAVTKEKVRKEYGWNRITKERQAKIEEYLKGEIKIFDTYLQGEVYGYVAEDEDGNHIESCWGFIGDEGLEDAIAEGKSCIDYELIRRHEAETKAFHQALAKHIGKTKSQIRAHVPVIYRTAFSY